MLWLTDCGTLLLDTDGVPAARSAGRGRDGRPGYFGLERIGATQATAGKSAPELVLDIKAVLDRDNGGVLADEVVLLAVQVAP